MALQRCSDRRFLDVNQSFIELSGYTAERLLRTHGPAIAASGLPGRRRIAFPPEGRLRHHPCVFRRSDGSNRQTLISVSSRSIWEPRPVC